MKTLIAILLSLSIYGQDSIQRIDFYRSDSIGVVKRLKSSKKYLKTLDKIGLIKIDWENKLTGFGSMILKTLKDKFETY